MIEDIKKAIEANLPAQVSKQLQEYLSEADQSKKDAINLAKLLKESKEECDKLNKLDHTARKNKLDEELLKLDKSKFEIEKRDWKIDELNNKYNDVKSLMSDVFRNQRMVYRSQVTEDRCFTDSHGINQYDNTTTTKETDKVEE